jgi:uncharacterized protein YpuA (DUF1002 family)
MSWSDSIPVATAFAAVFSAGVAWSTLKANGDKIKDIEDRLAKEHLRSATEQGKRIGDLETHVDALLKWKYREDGRRRERADTRGIPVPPSDDETPT